MHSIYTVCKYSRKIKTLRFSLLFLYSFLHLGAEKQNILIPVWTKVTFKVTTREKGSNGARHRLASLVLLAGCCSIRSHFRSNESIHIICPRSSDPFYIVSYYKIWVITSSTHSTFYNWGKLKEISTQDQLDSTKRFIVPPINIAYILFLYHYLRG